MKKFLFFVALFLSLNVYGQNAKVKIVLYPNTDAEFEKCMKIATDTLFSCDFCFEIIRKHKDETYPVHYSVVKVDFYSCEDNILLGVCMGSGIPTKKELMLFGNNSLTLANNPRLKDTKVFY